MDEHIARVSGYWLYVAEVDKDSNHWAKRYHEDVPLLLSVIADLKAAHLESAKQLMRLMMKPTPKE